MSGVLPVAGEVKSPEIPAQSADIAGSAPTRPQAEGRDEFVAAGPPLPPCRLPAPSPGRFGSVPPALEKPAYIPKDFPINSWDDLQPYFDELKGREFTTVAGLERLILDYNAVLAVYSEAFAWADINIARDTQNEAYKARAELFKAELQPKMDVESNALNEKIARHPLFAALPEGRYGQYKRLLGLELELFREENVPIFAELSLMEDKYNELMGALTAVVRGEELPLSRARALLRSPDRDLRREAWTAMNSAVSAAREELDAIYDGMIAKRHRIALNAGFANYRDYAHKARQRFDYTVADVAIFRDAIAEHVVKLAERIYDEHRARLGVESADFRPWDADWRNMAAAPDETPLHPFTTGEELIAKTETVQARLSPEYGEHVRVMREADLFDVDARPNKRGGGFNYSLPVSGQSFIFMNATGSHGDMETMQHEVGHGHQAFWTVSEPIMAYQDYPAEIAETASMGMELLSMKNWDVFYEKPEDLTRARREQLEGAILFMPWCAVVDEIQQWVYTHPGHTASERRAEFARIMGRYGFLRMNYEGFEDAVYNQFLMQGHVFWSPFYYVEYGISQLGSLQLYRNFKGDEASTLEAYKAGLSLGYSKPLPDVWQTLGIEFDFSGDKVKELMGFVGEELGGP